MNKLFFFLIIHLMTCSVVFGQQDEFKIIHLNSNALYAGYPNDVKIITPAIYQKNIIIDCKGCEQFNVWNPDLQEYVIRPKDTTFIELTFKNLQHKIIHKQLFPVQVIPDPELYIDSFTTSDVITSLPKELFLKFESVQIRHYKPNIWLWIVTCGDKEFSSRESIFDKEEFLETLTKLGKGSFTIEVRYYNQNFENRTFIGEFQFDLKK